MLQLCAVLGFLSLGLPDGVLGVAWPSMRRSFALPMDRLGVLLAATMAGYLASSSASGALVARLGVGRLLTASGAATAASALTWAVAPRWGLVVAGGVLAGLGAGAIDAGINAFAAARFSPRLIGWLHASYGVGATLGPLLTATLLTLGASWRGAYGVIGVLLLVLAAAFARTAGRWGVDPGPGEAAVVPAPLADAVRRHAVWVNVGLFFLYAGLEVGAGQWGYTWLVEGRGMAPGLAAGWVAAYWASLTAGRVALGVLAGRVAVETLLRVSLGAVPVAAAVLWAGPGPAGGAAGLALLGVALAPIYPLLVAATPQRVGRRYAAHAIGFQVAAFYLGTAALPGAAGVLMAHAGVEALGPVLLAIGLALVGLYGAGDRRVVLAGAAPTRG